MSNINRRNTIKKMDILFFLNERTKFIRYYYNTAGQIFSDTIRKIEAKAPPFNDPPYSEDEEPPYLAEWLQADEGLEVLGRSCLSMLSPSLHLYFKAWEKQLGVRWEKGERERVFKKGFLNGYQICFGSVPGVSWDECPADLALIEQITLARNRDQHPEWIDTMHVHHGQKDLEKYPRPFFISETERRMSTVSDMPGEFWMTPVVHVSQEALFSAIQEVDKLAEWLEKRLVAFRYG